MQGLEHLQGVGIGTVTDLLGLARGLVNDLLGALLSQLEQLALLEQLLGTLLRLLDDPLRLCLRLRGDAIAVLAYAPRLFDLLRHHDAHLIDDV
ncbi:MAG: hypothetical protein C4289_03360 [Chloroflexota bacterium]